MFTISRPITIDAVAAGEGTLTTCTARSLVAKRKSSSQFAAAVHGLGAHAGAAGREIGGLKLRHQPLQGLHERRFAEGSVVLAGACLPELACHAPEAAEGHGLPLARRR